MEGIISVEEGLASGMVLTAEEGRTVVRAITLMKRHADAIGNSGRPGAKQASEIIAMNILPFAETFLMMTETGMVLRNDDTKEIMDLLYPDPWGQAGGE